MEQKMNGKRLFKDWQIYSNKYPEKVQILTVLKPKLSSGLRLKKILVDIPDYVNYLLIIYGLAKGLYYMYTRNF